MADLIPCLTFQQPYASAIIDGPKRVENRPWRPPARYTAKGPWWFAVHAGMGWYPGSDDKLLDWRAGVPHYDGCEPWLNAWMDAPAKREHYPTRVILGLARVARSYNLGAEEWLNANVSSRRYPEPPDPAWAFGPECWVLDKVIKLPTPIPYAKGMLGLWQPDPGTQAQLQAAVAAHGERP